MRHRQCTTRPPLLTSQEVRDLIQRCWAPNPEDRPPFSRLVTEFEAILARVPRATMVKQPSEGGCCTLS